MKEEQYDNLFDEKAEEEKTDYRALFFKYFAHWKWFAVSVVACVALAVVYLYLATPIYNITAAVLIEDDKKGGSITSDLSTFADLGLINSTTSIDNEVEVLHSKSLIRSVISELGLYITYSTKDGLRTKDLYKGTPFAIDFPVDNADKLEYPIEMHVSMRPDGGIDVTAEMDDEEIASKQFAKLPAVLPTPMGTITFLDRSDRTNVDSTYTEFDVNITSALGTAMGYRQALTVEPTSKTTSVALISLQNSNTQRGVDFINKLIEIYNRNANTDKNEVALNTARFIDERIAIINGELGTTEEELESFKRQAGLTDLTSDAQIALTERSEYEKRRVENGTQLNLVQYLIDYIGKQENLYTPLPVNVGLDNEAISVQVTEYNELLLERQRLLRSSSESNPVIRRLNTEIASMRSGLVTSLESARRGLLIAKADLDREAGNYASRISDAPTQERRYVSIQRQQEIKAGLYLMLLQKREENNIALAATASKGKIIDDALADEDPVSPKKKIVLLIALVFGFGIPVGIIYVIDLFKYRIEDRSDVEKLTRVPIVGDVPSNGKSDGDIVVRENDNDLMAETFRNLRTNLLFMLDSPEKKVILITSTMSGEGKTFISSNLAVSLTLMGKRVIILGLDIRKPGLNKAFGLSHKEGGITQYLANPQGVNLKDLIRPAGVVKNLDILPGGPIPPNPTELLSRPVLDDLINKLRQEYDYVVLDTAPIGMVTDTQLIGRTADVSLYVCRAEYTPKSDYQFINDLKDNKRLPNLCTVINGIDIVSKKYGYYGYGHKYGYGRKYGYGYGYGYGSEHDGKGKQNNKEKK